MKRITLLFFAVIITFTTYCQTYLHDGDRCFDDGDYTCAIAKYNEIFKSASRKDKQIVEIKLTRAKWCAEHIETANQAFINEDYKTAKASYQNVLDSNPKDAYAKTQSDKCDEILSTSLSVSNEKLSFSSSGGNDTITVKTNADSYSVNNLPSWCTVQEYAEYFVVSCDTNSAKIARTDYFTVRAEDKTVIINVSQTEAPTILSVSSANIFFTPSEGEKIIDVKTNADDYQIIDLPSWCRISDKYSDRFVLVYDANTKKDRSGLFKIIADDKEIEINVKQWKQWKRYRCFNCPKGDFKNWGMTGGIAVMDYIDGKDIGLQLGIIYEPRFKYGFGLNIGLNYEAYTSDGEDHYDRLSLITDLEYSFNFSKWFNPYIYGGTSFDYGYSEDSNRFFKYIDFGVGIRINHLRFNIVKNIPWKNLEYSSGFINFFNSHQKFAVSIAYIF
jgi:hypothetical protein